MSEYLELRLQFLQLKIDWPSDVPLQGLRRFVRESLGEHGEPLRWAITNVEVGLTSEHLRKLHLEAVIIVSDS